ncbi:lysine N(6)-hydroxylase/L-ornithine N(5)-oxygenase family protein [Salsuginibacillus kocurii]|uniref:lysine N(6)-hydroxylase/L-ornithine N(5)-oxygenase family protein n=1 Tax=Salsuginibacillus kocurii TaxID=427078 RepID=UPI000381EDF5|nr:SidA/IucD/PvdA family monooxygenase [Salsuginibacillus kocurii]
MNDKDQSLLEYDVIGIGIGPFNLGLAALLDKVDDIHALFLERDTSFVWHPGMLLEGTVLNSNFIADLVTFADPTSPYTFLNYLHKKNRLYQFFFNKKMNMPRREYEAYGQWVADQLSSCRFGKLVTDVQERKERDGYLVTVADAATGREEQMRAKHIVVGTGSKPLIPEKLKPYIGEDIFHSSSYRRVSARLKHGEEVTVVGSGQSAAEIFYDLLKDQKYYHYKLSWFTRSTQFFQAESAKLAREVFSPDYVSYFRTLPEEERVQALPALDQARKGIEPQTLMEIYDLLYHRSIEREDPFVTLQALTEVTDVSYSSDGRVKLKASQWQKNEEFTWESDKVILATGYKPDIPEWFHHFEHVIEKEASGERYLIDDHFKLSFTDGRKHSIFMLTGIDHAHGTASTNLGLSVFRNQTIINEIAGREVYPIEQGTIFQQFQPKGG